MNMTTGYRNEQGETEDPSDLPNTCHHQARIAEGIFEILQMTDARQFDIIKPVLLAVTSSLSHEAYSMCEKLEEVFEHQQIKNTPQ
ncbi:MAG: hypothetical protein ACR2PT_24265 [Endozoicomonas sp.]